MRNTAAALIVVLAVLAAIAAVSVVGDDEIAVSENVIDLTDETFEHLTQSVTGGTTGSWFVLFHAPWCGHCKKMMGEWSEFADEMKGKINVARVDATANYDTARRFSLQGFPTMLYFHKGKMYEFQGDAERISEEFVRFVSDDESLPEAKDIPPLLPWYQFILDTYQMLLHDLDYFNRTKRGIIALFVGVGLLVGFVIGYIYASSTLEKKIAAAEKKSK